MRALLWHLAVDARNAKRPSASCPCLLSSSVPICRADEGALRVPSPSDLKRLCSTPAHRRCTLYRSWLRSLRSTPERWTITQPGDAHDAASATPGLSDAVTTWSRKFDGIHLAVDAADDVLTAMLNAIPRKGDSVMTLLRKLIADERAQDIAEYGIALTIIGAGAVIAAVAIGANVNALWSAAGAAIASAV